MSQNKITTLKKLNDKELDFAIKKTFAMYNIKYDDEIATSVKELIKVRMYQFPVNSGIVYGYSKRNIVRFTAITLSAILTLSTIYGIIMGVEKINEQVGLINDNISKLNSFNCTMISDRQEVLPLSCRYNSEFKEFTINNNCPIKDEAELLRSNCDYNDMVKFVTVFGGLFYATIQLAVFAGAKHIFEKATREEQLYKQTYKNAFNDEIGASAFDIYGFRKALLGVKQNSNESGLLDLPLDLIREIEGYLLPQNGEHVVSTLFFVDNLMMDSLNKIAERKDITYFKSLKSKADEFIRKSKDDQVQIIIENNEEKAPVTETTSLLESASARKGSVKTSSIQ